LKLETAKLTTKDVRTKVLLPGENIRKAQSVQEVAAEAGWIFMEAMIRRAENAIAEMVLTFRNFTLIPQV